tara:strand:- start:193 stop:726 length:534 start_codon:yes stop_codon:yes gene_type:complete
MKSQVWLHTLSHHKKIKTEILNLIEKSPSISDINNTNTNVTKTDYYKMQQTSNYFKVFEDNSPDLYEKLRKTYGFKIIDVDNVWFQQYFNEDIHDWHTHAKTNLSLVYFVELEKPKDSTEFLDVKNKTSFQLKAKEGDIVIFPSHIPHRSPKIISKKRKTVIAINLSLRGVNDNLLN